MKRSRESLTGNRILYRDSGGLRRRTIRHRAARDHGTSRGAAGDTSDIVLIELGDRHR